MQRLRAILIVLLITASLLPFYLLYQYLVKWIQPKQSLSRFIAWLILVLAMIFIYTFIVVFIIRRLFPSA